MMGVLLLAAAAVTNVVSNVAELKAVVPKLKWGSTLVLKDGVYDLSAWEAKGKDPVFLDLTMHANLRSESGRPEKCALRGPGERKPGRCLALDGDASSVEISNIEILRGTAESLTQPNCKISMNTYILLNGVCDVNGVPLLSGEHQCRLQNP